MKFNKILSKKEIKYYIYDENKQVIDGNSINQVNSIEEADIVIVNVQSDINNNFEPSVSSTIKCAKAESLNKIILTYGYDLELAHERANELGIEKNEIGLHISKDASKQIMKSKENAGDFFYENVNGNGMIFSNENIINFYNIKDVNEIIKNSKEILDIKRQLSKRYIEKDDISIKQMNERLSKGYETSIYETYRIEEEIKENQLNELRLHEKVYLIGDDVFFISKNEYQETMSSKLLKMRSKAIIPFHNKIKSIAPFELVKDMSLNDLIKGNNSLAKYSSSFIANLQTMPKEDTAVDTGSLYEIALNLSKKGIGVINVDKNLYKETELNEYLLSENENILIIENGTHQEMALLHRLLHCLEMRTKINDNDWKKTKLHDRDIKNLLRRLKKVESNNRNIINKIERSYLSYKRGLSKRNRR